MMKTVVFIIFICIGVVCDVNMDEAEDQVEHHRDKRLVLSIIQIMRNVLRVCVKFYGTLALKALNPLNYLFPMEILRLSNEHIEGLIQEFINLLNVPGEAAANLLARLRILVGEARADPDDSTADIIDKTVTLNYQITQVFYEIVKPGEEPPPQKYPPDIPPEDKDYYADYDQPNNPPYNPPYNRPNIPHNNPPYNPPYKPPYNPPYNPPYVRPTSAPSKNKLGLGINVPFIIPFIGKKK